MLRVSGTAASEDEIHFRCDRVANFAIAHAGCKSWSLQDLLWLPLQIPYGQYAVQVGRPPMVGAGFDADGEWIVVESIEKAKRIISTNTHDLSGEDRKAWDRLFGRLMNGNGNVVAKFRADQSFAWRSTRFRSV